MRRKIVGVYAYLLAQSDCEIGIVQVPHRNIPKVGDVFDRWKFPETKSWTVIKIFDELDTFKIEALITLMGLPALEKLFALELLEPRSSEQELAEAIGRMGGEA